MRRVGLIAAAAAATIVFLCVVLVSPAPSQKCDTYEDKPDCDAFKSEIGEPCSISAVCLDLADDPCGREQVLASVSLPTGGTCLLGTGYDGECTTNCGGYAWAEALLHGQFQWEADVYCCSGCL